jgi:hypothetical protein
MTEGLNTPDDQPPRINWIDEAEAKIEEARAIIREMVETFRSRYEDAATRTLDLESDRGSRRANRRQRRG